MQKTMQKEVASNKIDETVGHVPYIYSNQATYQGSPQKRNALFDDTYTGSSGKPEVTLQIS